MYDRVDHIIRDPLVCVRVCAKAAESSRQMPDVFVAVTVGLKPVPDNIVQHRDESRLHILCGGWRRQTLLDVGRLLLDVGSRLRYPLDIPLAQQESPDKRSQRYSL